MGLAFGYSNAPLLTQLTAELGWTRTQFSSIAEGRIWITALGHPLIAWLALRFGGRPVLIASVVSIGIAGLGLSRMHSLWELALWQGLLGVVQIGVGDVVAGQVVAQWVAQGRGLALGIVYTGANAGALVLVNAVAAISTQLTWREAYLYTCVAGAVLLLPFAALAVRAPRPGEGVARMEAAAAGEIAEPGMDLASALRTRSFWLLAFALAAFFAYFVAVLGHFVPYLQDQGMDVRTAAAYYSTAVGLGLISKPLYGVIGDRMPARAGLLFNTGLFVVSACLNLALPQLWLLWAWIVVYGFSSTARDVVYPLIIIECFGARHMVTIYGALMLALVSGPLGSIAAASIHDRTGRYDGAFAFFAALNVLAFLGLLLVRRELAGEREER
jgi:MFS family permease